MSSVSSRYAAVARAPESAAPAHPLRALAERFHALYELAQKSSAIFGSPLGPFHHQRQSYHLPRFVYFGPHTSEDSLRLAFYAGHDRADLRSTLALVNLVEKLARDPWLGQGLNLSFFPLLDALGLFAGTSRRELADQDWTHSREPEIDLLGKHARLTGYHGFVVIDTQGETDDVIVATLRGAEGSTRRPTGVELVSSEDFAGWQVRFESFSGAATALGGPLSLVDDLPLSPYELRLTFPCHWSAERIQAATSEILTRFILRYRAHQAYACDL